MPKGSMKADSSVRTMITLKRIRWLLWTGKIDPSYCMVVKVSGRVEKGMVANLLIK